MKDRSQLTIIYTLTCLALVPIFALSGYYIYKSRQDAVSEKVKKLHAIAKSKQVTLENHLENYIKSIESVSKNKLLIKGLKTGSFDNGSYDLFRNLQEKLWGPFHHIFVADSNGEIILSPHHKTNLKSTHLNHSISKSKFFEASLKKTQVTDFFGFEESTHYHPLVMVPIIDNGKTVGVIVSEITIQYLIDLLRKDFELGKTGEIYLSTLDKKRVVHLKKDEIKNIEAPLLSKSLKDGSAYGENLSFGTTVLASYLKSSKYPWVLAVEISKDEVLAPINQMTKLVTAAYIFFVVVFLFVFKYIVKLLKKPVQDISKTIESISSGAIENSELMRKNTSGLVEGSMKLAEALVENQGQLERVVGQIKDDASVIKESLDKTLDAKRTASSGENIVGEMTKNISLSCDENENVQGEVNKVLSEVGKIVESVKLIQEKTKLINDIVFQTKLLSFNASVEAARAGEHGKGFAVVAEEVGNLAAMSGKASIEIHEMIDQSVKEIEEIIQTSNKSLKSAIDSSTDKISLTRDSIESCKELFLKIIKSVNDIHKNIGEVSQKAQEKVVAIDEVNDRFVSLKEVSEQSSTVANAVGSLTDKLKDDSDELERVSEELAQKFAA